MERTLVGVFDSQDTAQAVRQALIQAGIEETQIHTRAATASDMAKATTQAAGTSASSDRSDSQPGFFSRLFKDDDELSTHAGQYEEAVRRGSCVVVVDRVAEDQIERAAQILLQSSPIYMDERVADWSKRGWTGYDATAPAMSDDELRREREQSASYATARPSTQADGTSAQQARNVGETTHIPVVEEELAVGKRMVERGGVRIYTRMTELPVEENVTLRAERAHVERHAVNRPATEAELGSAFKEGSIELRETAEEAVVSKTATVVEEVEIAKQVEERTETVRDTVRRTDVDVEDLPASRTGGRTDDGARKRP
jgi:uncharacterized protein (TIGR02271 family)